MRIILLGPAGCGKGTQGELIEKKYGFPKISTGDLLREAVAEGTVLGKKAEIQMKQGGLVEDEIVVGIVRERILREDCRQGYALDGFPRNIFQAQKLEGIDGRRPEVVIEIYVKEEVLVERLAARRICPHCNAIYHLQVARSKREGVCEFCGQELIQRNDDRPEIIKERLRIYRLKTEPLIDYYKEKKVYHRIDGSNEIEAVFRSVSSLLETIVGEYREKEAVK